MIRKDIAESMMAGEIEKGIDLVKGSCNNKTCSRLHYAEYLLKHLCSNSSPYIRYVGSVIYEHYVANLDELILRMEEQE
jgi:hypothetical protein